MQKIIEGNHRFLFFHDNADYGNSGLHTIPLLICKKQKMLYLQKDTAKRTVSKGCSVNHFVAYLSSQGNFDVRIQRKYSNYTKKCQQANGDLVTKSCLPAICNPYQKSKKGQHKRVLALFISLARFGYSILNQVTCISFLFLIN
jgi:hypothetical protein